MVLDYQDALKQLVVAPRERQHFGGRARAGVVMYRVLLFGVKSGPLVGGRTAALLVRLTAAVIFHEPARLQGLVDDSKLATAGPEATKRRTRWK